MPDKYPPRGTAHGLCRMDVQVLLRGHYRPADDPGAGDTHPDGSHENYRRHTVPDDGHEQHETEQVREEHPGIDEPLYYYVECAAELSRRYTYD